MPQADLLTEDELYACRRCLRSECPVVTVGSETDMAVSTVSDRGILRDARDRPTLAGADLSTFTKFS
jgi:hypothetical protein